MLSVICKMMCTAMHDDGIQEEEKNNNREWKKLLCYRQTEAARQAFTPSGQEAHYPQ